MERGSDLPRDTSSGVTVAVLRPRGRENTKQEPPWAGQFGNVLSGWWRLRREVQQRTVLAHQGTCAH